MLLRDGHLLDFFWKLRRRWRFYYSNARQEQNEGIHESSGWIFEFDILGAFPQHHLAERPEVFTTFDNGKEVIPGQLAHFTREVDAAVSQQDFGFGNAARVQQELARCRIAGVIFEGETQVQITERDPAALAAPSDMNDLFSIWEQ
jgi:hypothetical protein